MDGCVIITALITSRNIFFNVFRADTQKTIFMNRQSRAWTLRFLLPLPFNTLSPPATNANADVLSGPAQPSILPCVCLPAD